MHAAVGVGRDHQASALHRQGQRSRVAGAYHGASGCEQVGLGSLGDDGYRAEADPELVGKVAHAAGVPLHELRAADGAGLEEMFLELTSETQREGVAA